MNRMGKEPEDRLLKLARIAVDASHFGADHRVEIDAFCIDLGAQRIDHADDDRRKTHRLQRGFALRGLELAFLLLQRPHLRIEVAARQQLLMIAAVDDAAVLEHEDDVRRNHRR